jgi:hypothetical protein
MVGLPRTIPTDSISVDGALKKSAVDFIAVPRAIRLTHEGATLRSGSIAFRSHENRVRPVKFSHGYQKPSLPTIWMRLELRNCPSVLYLVLSPASLHEDVTDHF